jgi:hypothetical protein
MDSISALAGLRTAIGVSAYAAPNTTAKLFGLDPDANPQATYLGRLFAVRDLVLGVGTMLSEPPARRMWLQAGVVCDLADAASSILAKRDGHLPAYAAFSTAAIAILAAGMGAAALNDA